MYLRFMCLRLCSRSVSAVYITKKKKFKKIAWAHTRWRIKNVGLVLRISNDVRWILGLSEALKTKNVYSQSAYTFSGLWTDNRFIAVNSSIEWSG